MTAQNNDFSQLLSFDKTITSKLSRAVFKKDHSCTDNRAFSKIEFVEYIGSQVFLLLSPADERKAGGSFREQGPCRVAKFDTLFSSDQNVVEHDRDDVTKSSSDNCPTFPRTVPFVRRRKRAIFNVEYLGDVLMKSCKTLDYDYFDYHLLFLSQNQTRPNFVAFDL